MTPLERMEGIESRIPKKREVVAYGSLREGQRFEVDNKFAGTKHNTYVKLKEGRVVINTRTGHIQVSSMDFHRDTKVYLLDSHGQPVMSSGPLMFNDLAIGQQFGCVYPATDKSATTVTTSTRRIKISNTHYIESESPNWGMWSEPIIATLSALVARTTINGDIIHERQ